MVWLASVVADVPEYIPDTVQHLGGKARSSCASVSDQWAEWSSAGGLLALRKFQGVQGELITEGQLEVGFLFLVG